MDTDDFDFEYEGEDGAWYRSYKDYVWLGILGFCGCYDVELFDDVFTVIESFENENGICPYRDVLQPKPREYVELILHILDRAGLAEYGTSIRRSWLTKEGKEVLFNLKNN